MSDIYMYDTDILSPDEEVIHDQNKMIESLQEQLKETQQELQIRINDNADMYAKLCNALMQLEEANNIIKQYCFYEYGKPYLKKWGVE